MRISWVCDIKIKFKPTSAVISIQVFLKPHHTEPKFILTLLYVELCNWGESCLELELLV